MMAKSYAADDPVFKLRCQARQHRRMSGGTANRKDEAWGRRNCFADSLEAKALARHRLVLTWSTEAGPLLDGSGISKLGRKVIGNNVTIINHYYFPD